MPEKEVIYRGQTAILTWADENASTWSIKISNETVKRGNGMVSMLAALDDHTSDLDKLEHALDDKEKAEKALKQAIKEKASAPAAGRRRKTRRRRHQRKTRRSRK
jgi:putative protein kinase ArgK-like GTPase of G3E family